MFLCAIPEWAKIADFCVSLAANLFTAFGFFSFITALHVFKKNKVHKNNVDCEPIIEWNCITGLKISNLTDKTFYIRKITLITKEEKCPALEWIQGNNIRYLLEIKNIKVSPFQALEFDCTFQTELPKKSILKIETTQKTLRYKINGNPNSNNQSADSEDCGC